MLPGPVLSAAVAVTVSSSDEALSSLSERIHLGNTNMFELILNHSDGKQQDSGEQRRDGEDVSASWGELTF